METDFRAFFLIVETITEIRWKTYFCWGKLVPASGNRLFGCGNHFFLHFSEAPTSASSFPSSRKVFLNEIFHSGEWKQILVLVETVFLFLVETVTEIS